MKKKIYLSIIAGLMITSLVACGKANNTSEKIEDINEKIIETIQSNGTASIGFKGDVISGNSSISAVAELPMNENETQAYTSDTPTDSLSETKVDNDSDVIHYSFADLKYSDDGQTVTLIPNGGLTDNTVLRNGKTFGEYVDYVNNTVLEDGRTVDKEFLRGLLACNSIDESFISEDKMEFDDFAALLVHCTTIANTLHSMNVTLHELVTDKSDINTQKLVVTAVGANDIWHVDTENQKFYFNDGKTEYNSTMFDKDTMLLWDYAAYDFFGEEY